MARQGRWTNWESLERKRLSWHDIWQMEGVRLSFTIRATYDLLPSPKNLKLWYREDPACSLCRASASLKHTGGTTNLTQGRYSILGGITKYSESWHQHWNRGEPPQITSRKHQQEMSTSYSSHQQINRKSTKQHQRVQTACLRLETESGH